MLFEKQGSLKQKSTPFGKYLYYLDNVSVEYGKVNALQSLSLGVEPGEILFVTGPSGAGKTTLINVMAGHIEPTEGRVVTPNLSGRDQFIAKVYQDLRFLPHWTCEDSLWISYDRSIYKSKNEFYSDMNELCRLFGMTDRLHLKIKDCNGGLKQKLAMVRALLTRPKLLLADEPTCSLDKKSAMKIFDVLSFYNSKRGLTIVWASHNKDLVKQFSGRIVHLDGGRLVYSGHACFI